MKSDYSHITLVCDRSGSMHTVQSDAEGAVNKFIADQKAVPGEATLLLVEFDADAGLSKDELRIGWYHVVHSGHISEAPTYRLHPRGNTALNDAGGRAITETGEFLDGMPDDQKPEHVFFVVQTDGQENSSRDWTLDKLRELIKTQQETWKWEFVFLGMGPDAFQQGAQLGFQNVTRSAHAPAAYAASYGNTSDHMAGVRGGQVKNMSGTNAAVDSAGNVTPDPVTPVET
jgi:hypothetical protein